MEIITLFILLCGLFHPKSKAHTDAGLGYKLNRGASVFLKSSFPNPLRSSFGFRIVL